MKCQFCNNQATVHVTDIANKRKRELHLCEKCARKHNLIPDQPTPHVDLKALLGLLIGSLQQQHQASATADPVALTCPSCGLQYVEFRAEGRLGCPDDYEAFRATLEPLLERIHRSQTHSGKLPLALRRRLHDAELRDLKKQMKAAAKAEQYEEAARLRDLIRQKEATDESR